MNALRFDPVAVRAAYEASVGAFLDLCRSLAPADWEKPALEGWNVRLLVGHTSRSLTTVRDYLAAGAKEPVELQHAFDYLPAVLEQFAGADSAALAARARAAAEGMGPEPLPWLRQLAQEVLAQVRATPDGAPLTTLVGSMRLVDYLPTRVFELVVHSADLALATGQRYRPAPQACLIAWTVAAAAAAAAPEPMPALLALTGRGPLPEGFSVVP
ncbi:MAG: maleylpyruvate isomerase N-terminal domain-containing protein [Myxococcales bacterium]